jgi:parvulin-like peptidyl-prolyl isomerase
VIPFRRGFVLLAAIPILLAACAAAEPPAASVGDAEISQEELQTDVVFFRFLSALSGAPCGAPIQGESDDAACARFTLTNDIQEEMVKLYAATNDVTVSASDVSDAIAQLEQNLGGAAQLDARLAEEGLDRRDLRSLADRLLLFNEVQQAVVAERLDDEALRAVYEEAKPQFTTVEVHHILLRMPRAAEVVAAEATPENFARLAKTRSIDPGSAASGGSLGSYSESQFQTQFDQTFVEAALALQAGEISGVVETQFGFHVIYMAQRDVASFDDVRERLFAQQLVRVFDEWLREQYETVDIEVNPRFGRLDPQTFEIVPVRSTEDDPEELPTNAPSPVP